MSGILKNQKGSAIITAIGLGLVLIIVVITVHIFTSHRTQTVVNESRRVKALGIAEAGLEFIIGELYNNSNFTTHELGSDLSWKKELNRETTLVSDTNHNFEVFSSSKGTYSGRLGDGDFKVRIGLIPYKDNIDTKAIDESRSYLKVEALGRFENTIRRVEAYLNRRYPAREFLMYDGGILSLVFGRTGSGGITNKNIFSVGHLYGHKGIEIGRILMSKHNYTSPGTDQELTEMNAIISGNGGIYFYSPIKAKFFAKNTSQLTSFTIPKNTTFPTNGKYEDKSLEPFGAFPLELSETLPSIPETLKPWIKDKTDGISITPRNPAFEQYKAVSKKTGGLFISDSSNSEYVVKYRMPKGWTGDGKNYLNAAYLDFGSNIRNGNVEVPANGVIYSDKDIVIKGNPTSNVSIVSAKNIFVAGDFNQRGDRDNIDEFYCFPQDYEGNALKDHTYNKDCQNLLKNDVNSDFKHHFAATVIARERIVYDYRSPVDCFENELFPVLKYKLAEHITENEALAKANCLEKNRSSLKASSTTVEDFSEKIDSFFTLFKLDSESSEASIKESFKKIYEENDGEFDFATFDKMTRELWESYATNYESSGERGALSASAKSSDYGVYTLLNTLKQKLNIPLNSEANENDIKDTPGDYLYFPEVTCNGMFISCGKLNNTFYAGPDVQKYYNKIGLYDPNKEIGLKHSFTSHFIHRMFGSEVNMRLYDVHRITKDDHDYIPPTRRKIYDDSLPTLGLDNSKYELAGFVVLSWADTSATEADYNNF